MKKIISAVLFSAPFLALADNTQVTGIFSLIDNIVKPLIARAGPLLIALAVLYFLYGVIKYVMAAGDEEKQGAAKSIILWGIVCIFVMVSVWGLVNFLVGSFNLNNSPLPPPPIPNF